MVGGAPPPPRWRNDDDENLSSQFWPIFTTFDLWKKLDFWPSPHLRVQHILLINLMGLMTFFERKFFSRFCTTFGPSENNAAASEFHIVGEILISGTAGADPTWLGFTMLQVLVFGILFFFVLN